MESDISFKAKKLLENGRRNKISEKHAHKKKKWSTRASIPVPRACKARALPIELVPLLRFTRRIILTFIVNWDVLSRLFVGSHPSLTRASS